MAKLVSHYDSPHYSTFYRSSNPDNVESTELPLSVDEGFPTFAQYKVIVTQRVVYIIGMDLNSENCLLLTISRNLQDQMLKIAYENFGFVFPAAADAIAYITELSARMKNPIELIYSQVYGILGVIQLQRYYLHIILERSAVANVLGKPIFRIENTAYIELNSLDEYTFIWNDTGKFMRLKIDAKVEQQYFDLLKANSLARQCFFSNHYDVTNNLQTSATQPSQIPNIGTITRSSTAPPPPPPPELLNGTTTLPDTHIPYISDSSPHSNIQYNYPFTWNSHLLRTFVQFFPHSLDPFEHFPLRASLSSFSLQTAADDRVISLTGPYSPYRWYTPVIQGYISQTTFVMNKICYHQTLIARRSISYAGTRYNRRGINSSDSCFNGGVANEVETEMILQAILPPHLPQNANPSSYQPSLPHSQLFVSSATLVRGSIPLLWKQTGDMALTPDIHVQPLHLSYPATFNHFKGLLSKYHGRVHIVSLIKQKESKKKREMLLGEAYGYASQHVNSQLCNDSFMLKLHQTETGKSKQQTPEDNLALPSTTNITNHGENDDNGKIKHTEKPPSPPTYLMSYTQPWYTSPSPIDELTSFSDLSKLKLKTCPCFFNPISSQIAFFPSPSSFFQLPPQTEPGSFDIVVNSGVTAPVEDNALLLKHRECVHHIGVPSLSQNDIPVEHPSSPGPLSDTILTTNIDHSSSTTHPPYAPSPPQQSVPQHPQHPQQLQQAPIDPNGDPIKSQMGKAVAYHTYDFLSRKRSGFNPLDELIPLVTKIVEETSIFGAMFSNSPSFYPYADYSPGSIPAPPPVSSSTSNLDLMDLLCTLPPPTSSSNPTTQPPTDYDYESLVPPPSFPSSSSILSTTRRPVRSLYNTQHMIVTSLQSGVARPQCIDSLDRTNACMFIFGRVILKQQLNHLNKLIALATNSESTPSIEAPRQYDTLPTPLVQILQHTFTEHGDKIAHQYTGTNAMHKELLFVQDSSTRKVGNNPLYYPRIALDNDRILPDDFTAPYRELTNEPQLTKPFNTIQPSRNLRSPTPIGHIIPTDRYQYPLTLLQYFVSKDKCENIAALLTNNHKTNNYNVSEYIIVLTSTSSSFQKWLEHSPKEYQNHIYTIQQQHQEYNRNARRQNPHQNPHAVQSTSSSLAPSKNPPKDSNDNNSQFGPTTSTPQLTLDVSQPQSPPPSQSQASTNLTQVNPKSDKQSGFFSAFKWGKSSSSKTTQQPPQGTSNIPNLGSPTYIENDDSDDDDYSPPSAPNTPTNNKKSKSDGGTLSPFEKMSGMVTNGFTAAKRYYINNVTDTETQRQINLYLGFYIPFYSKPFIHFYRHLWELPVDVVYTDTDSKFVKTPQSPFPPALIVPFLSPRLYLVPTFSKHHIVNLKHYHTSFYGVPSVILHGIYNPSVITRLVTHFKTKAFTEHIAGQQILIEDEPGDVMLIDVENITQCGNNTQSVLTSSTAPPQTIPSTKIEKNDKFEFQPDSGIDCGIMKYTNNPLSPSFHANPAKQPESATMTELNFDDDEYDQLFNL